MTDIEFPMYFSLVPSPGYDISVLESLGVGGEWEMFTGDFSNEVNETGGTWVWGSVDNAIEGNLDSLVKSEKLKKVFLKMFGLRVEWM